MKIAKDDVCLVTWDKRFELARITESRTSRTAFRLAQYNPPLLIEGRPVGWAIELWEVDGNGKLLRPAANTRLVYPPSIGEAEMQRQIRLVKQKHDDAEKRLTKHCSQKLAASIHDPLRGGKVKAAHSAQLKVLAKAYSKTVALKMAESKAPESKQATIKKRVFEAYKLETAAATGRIVEQPASDPKEIIALAKALERKRWRRDPVNDELALNWEPKGYFKMKPQELVKAIYNATGKRFLPKTLARRARRLGLYSSIPQGRPKTS